MPSPHTSPAIGRPTARSRSRLCVGAEPRSSAVTHVGDSQSPCSTRIPNERLGEFLLALLEIPEHHYFVPDDRSWVAVISFGGDVDLVVFETV